MTLLSLIAPDDIRGLMFSLNGLIGGLFVTASNGLGWATLSTDMLTTWWSASVGTLLLIVCYILLGMLGKLKL